MGPFILCAPGKVTLWSRHATDLTGRFPRIASAIRSLPADDVMLDGEAVVLRPDGHTDFAALRTKRGADDAQMVVFDLLHIDGEDRRKLPLEVRRAELESLAHPPERIDQALEVGLADPLGPCGNQLIGQRGVAEPVELVAAVPERDLALVQQPLGGDLLGLV